MLIIVNILLKKDITTQMDGVFLLADPTLPFIVFSCEIRDAQFLRLM